MDLREPAGEDYVADPRERFLRIVAQMIDKPLTVLLVFAAFGAAARGPGLLVPGYQPSAWFVLGLWLLGSVAIRLLTMGLASGFRAMAGIEGPRAPSEMKTE
ncbi:MAG: hypothetical protein EA355_07490 [Rhodobacteraceae bacterium]|nr:MAG: hypothetical protein EA355_07490 [Paracoccaceae bacterium]